MSASGTLVGVAYSEYVPALTARAPGLIDYIEIPFEQLIQTPQVAKIGDLVPIVLHCASLSLAGNLPISDPLFNKLKDWVRITQTPWVGEHLAYVRADGQF